MKRVMLLRRVAFMTIDCVGAKLTSLHIIDNRCRSEQLYGASISAQLSQVEHGQGSLLLEFDTSKQQLNFNMAKHTHVPGRVVPLFSELY